MACVQDGRRKHVPIHALLSELYLLALWVGITRWAP